MSTLPPPNSSEQPTPNGQPEARRHSLAGKLLLAVSAVLLFGWLGWLSYTALTKSHEPTVSHAQAAAASVPVVAELKTGQQEREALLVRAGGIGGHTTAVLKEQAGKPAFIVTVKEQLVPNGPAFGTEIGVANLPGCAGYTDPGEYLLLLNKDEATLDGKPAYFLAGQQRSPGADLDNVGPPMIYKWGPDVRAQVKKLFPTGP